MICFRSTLGEFFEAVYVPRTMISPDTAASYSWSIRQFDRFARYPSWNRITIEQLGEFFAFCLASGNSPQTVLIHYAQLRAILALARRLKRIKIRIADIPRPKADRKLPTAWSLDEFCLLVEAARSLEGKVGPWPLRNWLPALMLTTWSTDWRISAVMATQARHVNLEAGHILSRERKTREERFIPLVPEAIPFLKKIWGPRQELFGDWAYDRGGRQWKGLNALLAKVIARAGVRDIGRFHAIRKTAITAVARCEGLDAASRFAGHSHHSTTSRHYVDPRQMGAQQNPLPRLPIQLTAQLNLF